ncbi:bifunctional (p)ppGpp synthetase/guanosine-3',5'-bis(diphosphate) 3'-pyrophosphohydrolase [Myxococcota bacterium]|nr:bifunctional (p)ppGpp synthetase/guanosine-3',5'-bis(diphosphate) 3'-pyrophosphohydrolase [Myxococcota bacterium]MBU1899411.1 bifunctional (p)ppGpp synthetase/guanosine-3',5'-bis(diphosphate) 3'-pyrophosphohydrolase [Myxococcota bacterium]
MARIRIEAIVDELQKHHPNADVDKVRRAYIFSAAAHQGQVRRSGEPYLVHPLEVSHIVACMHLDDASVCAALLHDTVEDVPTVTVELIKEQFGEDIAFLVDGLTKLEKTNFTSAEEAQAENFRKMLIAMGSDLRVILIKLADRVHNMKTLEFMTREKQIKIAQETIDIYAPLADRLGVHWIKTELEELCFKYLYPEEYTALYEEIAKTRAEREADINKLVEKIQSYLAELGMKVEVKGRPKHLWSIRQKMKITGRGYSGLNDIMAYRILVDTVGDCYSALGFVHALFKPISGRIKDYIAMPKENNYQSLHTTVFAPGGERMEIQIRTHEMHGVADLGIAAHWSYKAGQYGLSKKDDGRFTWLRQLLDLESTYREPRAFMNLTRMGLFVNEVYVFTPNGDVHALPKGSTPIDFAYLIHTDLGHECTGAKVNGTQTTLRYELVNGDIVSIQRTTGSQPKSDWLKFVKTNRARTKIRAFLRQEANARSLQLGTELLEKELKRFSVSLSKLRKDGSLDKALEEMKYHSERDFCLALGYGKTKVEVLLGLLIPQEQLDAAPQRENEEIFKSLIREARSGRSSGLVVDGLEGIATHFPKCCSPVPGDEIVGFVSRGRGVTIHRADCERINDADPARRVHVHWDDGAKPQRPVKICVYSENQPGLLASMSQAFHNAGLNISEVNCRTTADQRAINHFTVLVSDREQLNRIMTSIQRLPGVTGVERIGQ